MFKASNLKSFALGAGLAISALGVYALAATLTTFNPGDVVSSSKINENFAALNTTKQARVTGTCAAGSSIREIAADGTVTCQADNGGPGGITYSAGAGLKLVANTFSIDTTVAQTYTVNNDSFGLQVTNTSTSFQAVGIKATSAGAFGVAIQGIATGTGTGVDGAGPVSGVSGRSDTGTGVNGGTNTGIGIRGQSSTPSGKAGKFDGKVEVNGDTTVTGTMGITGNTTVTGDVNLTGKLNKKFSSTSNVFSQATPVAYGTVRDGALDAATPNVTATKSQDGVYEVSVAGYDLVSTKTVVVATVHAGVPRYITSRVVTSTDSVLFNVWDSAGNLATTDNTFYFVIYSL